MLNYNLKLVTVLSSQFALNTLNVAVKMYNTFCGVM